MILVIDKASGSARYVAPPPAHKPLDPPPSLLALQTSSEREPIRVHSRRWRRTDNSKPRSRISRAKGLIDLLIGD